MSIDYDELKRAVREAMSEAIGGLRQLPASTSSENVTEIIIRVGPSGGLHMSGMPEPFDPPACCMSAAPLTEETEELLSRLADRTGLTRESLLRQVEAEANARRIADELRRLEESIEG